MPRYERYIVGDRMLNILLEVKIMFHKKKNMSKRTKWTIEEERVLVDQITRSANNLREAFRRTAILTGRSKIACEIRWYKVVSKREDTEKLFAIIGYKTKNVNRKNVASNTSDNTEKTTVSWWRKFLSFLEK